MRTCKYCGIEKPESEFGKHPTCKDGLQTRCKACRNMLRVAGYHGYAPVPPVQYEAPTTRTCIKCEAVKPLAAFSRDKKAADGLQHTCKKCVAAANRAYRESVSARSIVSPETKTCAACGLEKPKSEFSPWVYHSTGLRSSCKACRRDQAKKNWVSTGKTWKKNFVLGKIIDLDPRAAIYTVRESKRGADKFDHSWELTDDEALILVTGDCAYCGSPPELRLNRNTGKTFASNGIDRIDSTMGYIKGNCVSCCWRCNRLKGRKSLQEFVDFLKDIYAFAPHAIARIEGGTIRGSGSAG